MVPMKFPTLLSILSAVLLLLVVFYDGKGGLRLPVGAAAHQSASDATVSSHFLPGKSVNVSSNSPINPSSPDVFSSAAGFLKEKFSDAPALNTHRTWTRGELRIARGYVVEQLDSGLVLNCGGWIVKSTRGYVYAGDGQGMNAMYANLVDAHEQFQFGRLMTVEHGELRQSVYDSSFWTPESYLLGPALVKGYPLRSAAKGKGIKVIVAPDGTAIWQGNSIPAYTVDFILTD
jgi:hypothetical protein